MNAEDQQTTFGCSVGWGTDEMWVCECVCPVQEPTPVPEAGGVTMLFAGLLLLLLLARRRR